MVEIMSVKEATEMLKVSGIPMTQQKLRAGLEQCRYPFGECIVLKTREFIIYKKLLKKFIEERDCN